MPTPWAEIWLPGSGWASRHRAATGRGRTGAHRGAASAAAQRERACSRRPHGRIGVWFRAAHGLGQTSRKLERMVVTVQSPAPGGAPREARIRRSGLAGLRGGARAGLAAALAPCSAGSRSSTARGASTRPRPVTGDSPRGSRGAGSNPVSARRRATTRSSLRYLRPDLGTRASQSRSCTCGCVTCRNRSPRTCSCCAAWSRASGPRRGAIRPGARPPATPVPSSSCRA